MDIDALLQSLRENPLSVGIRDSLYWFPMFEAVHVIGLALVFGTILVIDLRMIGKASTNRAFTKIHRDIVKWTWIAFAITLVTGIGMFQTNPVVYYHNGYFRVKMLLLALAAINMGAFELTIGRRSKEWGHQPHAPGIGRAVGVLSLAIWLGVIFCGRMIGFTTTRAAVTEPAPTDVNLDDLFAPEPTEQSPPSNTK